MLVAAGGSATTDGGAGAIEAVEAAGGLGKAKLEVLCDVSIPFERAAEVFAPQRAPTPRRLLASPSASPPAPAPCRGIRAAGR